jgi:hypothetical protein
MLLDGLRSGVVGNDGEERRVVDESSRLDNPCL